MNDCTLFVHQTFSDYCFEIICKSNTDSMQSSLLVTIRLRCWDRCQCSVAKAVLHPLSQSSKPIDQSACLSMDPSVNSGRLLTHDKQTINGEWQPETRCAAGGVNTEPIYNQSILPDLHEGWFFHGKLMENQHKSEVGESRTLKPTGWLGLNDIS